MAIADVIKEYKSDNDAIHKFCDDLYSTLFNTNFEAIRDMYKRMKSNMKPITDDELEYILTTFPLELFTVAENLNKLRLDREVVKLKNKEKLESIRKKVEEAAASLDVSKAEKQDWIHRQVTSEYVEYEIVLTAYDSVITRVENEQSFSRELIMGAKKIWDSRRSSESVNPVGPVVPNLPEYDRNRYIK